MWKATAIAAVIFTFTFLIFNCPAQTNGGLTAVVTPGYTFASGEIPTTVKLNLLATPSIQIYGTVGGSNGLAADSVNGAQLYHGVVDGSTVDFNGASPRQIEIKASGVGVTQIATNVAGAGLSGGAGSPLAVQVDNTNILITSSNLLSLNTNVWGPVSNCVTGCSGTTNQPLFLQLPLVASGTNIYLTNFSATLTNVLGTNFHRHHLEPQPLAYTPRTWSWVLLCATADNGYSVGDEISVLCWMYGKNAQYYNEFNAGASSSNLFIVSHGVPGGDSLTFLNKTSGAAATPTTASWRLKCYAFQ